MSCHVMLCYAMLCYAMLCYAMLCCPYVLELTHSFIHSFIHSFTSRSFSNPISQPDSCWSTASTVAEAAVVKEGFACCSHAQQLQLRRYLSWIYLHLIACGQQFRVAWCDYGHDQESRHSCSNGDHQTPNAEPPTNVVIQVDQCTIECFSEYSIWSTKCDRLVQANQNTGQCYHRFDCKNQ